MTPHYNDLPARAALPQPVPEPSPAMPIDFAPSTADAIAWNDWTADAFARAARERKPVLLSIGASWCHGCAVMDRATYADKGIVALVSARTVPVRVDADRRPDINDRYNLEGWPTTALLTPSGEILTGTTYASADVLSRMVADAVTALEDRYDELMRRSGEVAAARRAVRPFHRYEPDIGAPDRMFGPRLAQHDADHGGFGTGGKFLHAAALQFALDALVRGDERLAPVLTRTFDGMLAGTIVDDVDGGFFRYAASRDWLRPHTEKVLEDQAAMALVLAEASVAFDRADYRARALDTVGYVQRTLADQTRGGFFASQRADEDYYGVSGSIRETLDPPVIDRTLFTDANAQATVAWLRIGALLELVDLGRYAVTSMERVLVATYQPGEGVAHWADPHAVRGLLTDPVHAAWALLHLHEATGSETYPMLAEELMRTAVRTLWDEDNGGFRDRAPSAEDVGLMADPVKPLALNSLAARVLTRLARLTGRDDLQRIAEATLAALTGTYRNHGLAAAAYASAIVDVTEPLRGPDSGATGSSVP
jgi:uncharacterized protein YyaL (SSP411 family)